MRNKKLLVLTALLAYVLFGNAQNQSYIKYIGDNIPLKEEIDVFVNEQGWVKFDPVSGYTLNKSLLHNGVDNSYTILSSQNDGARTQIMYKNHPSRINTYGNSFTQSSQVNDGESWQEYLAAHLGEPIRNYGVGGLGTYQAYRRMLRAETSDCGAEYVILYIWGGDHIRSLMRCRYMATKDWHTKHYKTEGVGKVFHGNFWSNIEMDLKTGRLTENENRIQIATDMYKMTDSVWMVDNLKDDLALQMHLYKINKIDEIDIKAVEKLAECLHIKIDFEDREKLRENVSHLLDQYGFAASKYIVKKAQEFANSKNKKLMILLFDPYRVTRSLIEDGSRYDQTMVDFLEKGNYNFFDMNLVHAEDYKNFKISLDDYFKRYFIGHYNPAGNHFFAFSIKNKVVEWLEPKPVTYQKADGMGINFMDYLDGMSKVKNE